MHENTVTFHVDLFNPTKVSTGTAKSMNTAKNTLSVAKNTLSVARNAPVSPAYQAVPTPVPGPAPVMPVIPPKLDNPNLPVGSEFYISQVLQIYRDSAGARSQLTVEQARQRYEMGLTTNRMMTIRDGNPRIGGEEAMNMARTERAYTPKPSDAMLNGVIGTAIQIEAQARQSGNSISLFAAVEKAVAQFR